MSSSIGICFDGVICIFLPRNVLCRRRLDSWIAFSFRRSRWRSWSARRGSRWRAASWEGRSVESLKTCPRHSGNLCAGACLELLFYPGKIIKYIRNSKSQRAQSMRLSKPFYVVGILLLLPERKTVKLSYF